MLYGSRIAWPPQWSLVDAPDPTIAVPGAQPRRASCDTGGSGSAVERCFAIAGSRVRLTFPADSAVLEC